MSSRCFASLIAACCTFASALFSRAETATFPVDPVELVNGNEVPGDESISAERWQFRYLFVNEKNRMEFEARPEKYEIQLGGACARMGMLSREGSVDRYTVHEGKIYLFASEPCRRAFLFEPEHYLEADDPPVTADESSAARAREIIERAVAAMGGADRLDSLRSYREVAEKKVTIKDAENRQATALMLNFPAGIRKEEEWNEKRWMWVEAGDEAWYVSDDGVRRALQPVERWAMRRTLLWRHPVALLRARNEPGFIASYAGARTVQHRGKAFQVDEVHVSIGGTTCTLGFEPATGLLRTQSYRGMVSRMGVVLRVFTDRMEVDGLLLPSAWDVQFDGEFRQGGGTVLSRIEVAGGDE